MSEAFKELQAASAAYTYQAAINDGSSQTPLNNARARLRRAAARFVHSLLIEEYGDESSSAEAVSLLPDF